MPYIYIYIYTSPICLWTDERGAAESSQEQNISRFLVSYILKVLLVLCDWVGDSKYDNCLKKHKHAVFIEEYSRRKR